MSFYSSRDGGTRTLMPCGTRSLVWSVYQFQHIPEVKVLLYLTLVEPSGVEPLPMDFQSIVRWPPIRQLHKFPYCQRTQPGTGNGIRTHVTCLKGTSPGPLADIPAFIFYCKDNKNIWNIQIFFCDFLRIRRVDETRTRINVRIPNAAGQPITVLPYVIKKSHINLLWFVWDVVLLYLFKF